MGADQPPGAGSGSKDNQAACPRAILYMRKDTSCAITSGYTMCLMLTGTSRRGGLQGERSCANQRGRSSVQFALRHGPAEGGRKKVYYSEKMRYNRAKRKKGSVAQRGCVIGNDRPMLAPCAPRSRATLLHMQGANLTHVRLLRTYSYVRARTTCTSRNEQQTLVHTGLALCSTISICYVLRYYVNTISPHSCYIASKQLEVIVRALC